MTLSPHHVSVHGACGRSACVPALSSVWFRASVCGLTIMLLCRPDLTARGFSWFFSVWFGFCFALFLAMPHDLRDPSSPAKDGTSALGSESLESSPPDHRGIPQHPVSKPTKGIRSVRPTTRGQWLLCSDACSEGGSLKTLEWFQTSGSGEVTGTSQSTQQTQMGLRAAGSKRSRLGPRQHLDV